MSQISTLPGTGHDKRKIQATVRPCFIYAHALMEDGSLDWQSVKRCEIAARLFAEGKVDYFLIATSEKKGDKQAAYEMRCVLMKYRVPLKNIHAYDGSPTTIAETRIFIGHLLKLKKEGVVVSPIVVTSMHHVPRVKSMWKHFLWTAAEFIGVDGGFDAEDLERENRRLRRFLYLDRFLTWPFVRPFPRPSKASKSGKDD